MASNTIGKVTQVLGAVVDVQFEGDLPAILNALHTENQGKTLLIVTHDRSLSKRTERVLHLLDGHLHRDESNGNGGEYVR